MIYTDEENTWLSRPRNHKKSNTNRQRRVKETERDRQAGHWFVNPTRAWGIRTTIEVAGKTYVVPVQL